LRLFCAILGNEKAFLQWGGEGGWHGSMEEARAKGGWPRMSKKFFHGWNFLAWVMSQ